MSKPKVDVTAVIPFYNSSATLQRAIDSVLDQTVEMREIIVIDDGSGPEEARQATAIVARTPGARLIVLESNGGPGDARNAGWNAASGEWIAFLDSDDVWHHRKIEHQLRALELSDSDAIFIASQRMLVHDKRDLDSVRIPESPKVIELTKFKILLRNWSATPTVMLRRDIPVRFPSGRRYAEDYALWLLVASLDRPMIRVESTLVGIFKEAYGEAGLSASVFRMIGGEALAFLEAFCAGAIGLLETVLGLMMLTGRVLRRLVKLGFRRLGGARWKLRRCHE